MKAKDYLQTLGIQDETIYDNAERMHSLECLLDDFLQENQAKNNEVLDRVSGLLPTIEDSGVIGLTIAKKCSPKLSENETSFFIAGFMEAIKYIKTNNR